MERMGPPGGQKRVFQEKGGGSRVNTRRRGAEHPRQRKPHVGRPHGRRELREFKEPRELAENSGSLSLSSHP